MSRKIILRVLIALVLAIILILILLPGIAKRYVIKNSKELVGRQIEMDKLKVNYFTGFVRITDFAMFEENDRLPFVTWDTLSINLEPFQFFIDELVVEDFYLKGLKVNVVQIDSTFNFDDLVDFHSVEPDSLEENTGNEEPFRFNLSNIELNDAEIHFEDQNVNQITSMREISFFVPHIGWNQQEKSEAGLRFAFKNEGYFESSINIDPKLGDYEAEITIHHLYLDTFKEYVIQYMNINEISGLFNSVILLEGNIYEAEKSIISGYAEVIDFELIDTYNRKFLGANKLEAVLKEMDAENKSFILDSLILNDPYVYFELDTVTNNFHEVFGLNEDPLDSLEINLPEVSSTDDIPSSVYYAVNSVIINDGMIDYTDNLTGKPFEYNLSKIVLEADSIESTSSWINLYSEMLLNKRGTLVAEVGLDPSDPMNIDLSYVITEFQLSDLNIYSRFYMGFPIVYGNMFYQADTKISEGQLNSENKLILHNVELGEKGGGLYDLPIKFALFLLKDKDGVITLDVPVRGDLNDPKVSFGKLIWSTFKNLIVKVASAPFNLLAGLISGDPKDIQSIDFEYTDTTLTEYHKKQLDMLLQIEEKKEGLDVELVYFNDPVLEAKAFAYAKIGKEFNKKTSKDYLENKGEFEEYVFLRLGADTLDVEHACYLLAEKPLMDSLVIQYNQIRKSKITNFLISSSDSTDIMTSISSPKAPKNVGSPPLFEVKYSMRDGSLGGKKDE